MSTIPELREQKDLFVWAKRLGAYLRSTVIRGGRGILTQQTDAGVTVSLGNHSDDHKPGGKDEIVFPTLEIVEPDPVDPENPRRIILNPAWSDFLASRIFCVNDDGTFTGWRTLLDLLDGLTGFAAGKALVVNAEADGLEFGTAGSGLPTGTVGQIAYHNGTAWVVLAKPASDMFLKNTAAGAVAWSTTPAPTVQSSGGAGVSLVTADGKIKTIYGT